MLSAAFLNKLREIIRWFDDTIGRSGRNFEAFAITNHLVPFEIVSTDDGKIKALHLYFVGNRFDVSESVNPHEVELFAIGDDNPGVGDRVWAAYRGRWEIVGGGGGARPIYGTIMEAVPANENNDAKLPAFGKVRVDGKTYETADGEIQYDHCGCWELAHQSNEVLIVGMSVKLTGPHTHVETVDGEEKTTVYYLAVETPGGYISKLNEQLESDGTATITIRNGDEDTLFIVRGTVLGPDDYMKSGSGVHVHRTVGKNGTWLEVTAGDCPAHHEDDEESAI